MTAPTEAVTDLVVACARLLIGQYRGTGRDVEAVERALVAVEGGAGQQLAVLREENARLSKAAEPMIKRMDGLLHFIQGQWDDDVFVRRVANVVHADLHDLAALLSRNAEIARATLSALDGAVGVGE